MLVHDVNASQWQAWDGPEGAYWAANADSYDRAVAAHHDRLLHAAAVGSAERVLDVGCGTGQVTLDAARAATAGEATGVDLSSAMLDVARRRAADDGLTNARFEQADAQVHPFQTAGFDVVVSRTGAMFFDDPVAAFANLARAVRRGGRLVLLTWQAVAANEWFRELTTALAAGRTLPTPPPSAPGPFGLSEPDRVRTVLQEAGFGSVELDGFHAPMWFGRDAADAQRFVLGQLGWLLEGLDADGQARAKDALLASTDAHTTADGVVYDSAAWIVSATR